MSKPTKLATIAALALALVGCASEPYGVSTASSSTPTSHPDYKACAVATDAGFDDNGIGQLTAQGLSRAHDEQQVQTDQVAARNSADYATAIQQMVSAECSLIMGVGSDLASPLTAAARVNTDTDFVLVDASGTSTEQNLKSLRFQITQPGFLAGYLAAGSSSSGTVGVFGSTNVPRVTGYMDGFVQGVSYYNAQKSTQVHVVGWTLGTQTGDFVEGNNPETDSDGASDRATALIDQGADVIFAVTGSGISGAIDEVAAHDGARIIGTDVDLCSDYADHCSIALGSATKSVEQAVVDVISESSTEFSNESYVGTLANDGVGISGVGEGASVDQGLIDEISQAQQGIEDGTISISSPSTVS